MNLQNVRYGFEHRILPNGFYTDKQNFVGMILNNKNVIFEILSEMLEKENIDNPYTADQFRIDSAQLTDEYYMLKLTFPEPEEEPLCYWCYLIYDKNFERTMYFCLEKAGDSDTPVVCAWNAKGEHMDYGSCALDDTKAFTMCSQIFKANVMD